MLKPSQLFAESETTLPDTKEILATVGTKQETTVNPTQGEFFSSEVII
ncbi:MAG TPA: hypothetical protein VK145_02080 [Candidatus Nanoarchaeia archaeon]|nr:hypothetical protein [Candidatus Nanoarchaeia archaeon]